LYLVLFFALYDTNLQNFGVKIRRFQC